MRVGCIGIGGRLGTLITDLLALYDDAELAAYVEVKTREQLMEQHPKIKEQISCARSYPTAEAMLESETLDGIMIGTRCSSHARLAELVIKKGIPLFLEKPAATTLDDWQRLRNIYEKHNNKAVVSFPLRVSPLLDDVKEI